MKTWLIAVFSVTAAFLIYPPMFSGAKLIMGISTFYLMGLGGVFVIIAVCIAIFMKEKKGQIEDDYSEKVRSTLTTITGQIERVIYTNEESGFSIAIVGVNGQQDLITVIGNLFGPMPGEVFYMQGEWFNHPKFGKLFKVVQFKRGAPNTAKGIQKYLGLGLLEGSGIVSAGRIVDKFGIKTLDIIENEIEKLAEIRGISDKLIAMLAKAWDKQKENRKKWIFKEEQTQFDGQRQLEEQKRRDEQKHLFEIKKIRKEIWDRNWGKCELCGSRTKSVDDGYFEAITEDGCLYHCEHNYNEEIFICDNCYKECRERGIVNENAELFRRRGIDFRDESHPRYLPPEIRQKVYYRDEGKCQICGSNKNLQYDHIIPFSKGGSNNEDNFQLLCEECNKLKLDKI